MHLLLGLGGGVERGERKKKIEEKSVFLPTTKPSLIRGKPTVPLMSTQWKSKAQVLKALGEKKVTTICYERKA